MRRFKLLACKALYREISLITAKCGNFIDVTYLKQGFHDTPKILNDALKEELKKLDEGNDIYSCPPAEGRDFDAILLGYGLCSNSIIGLKSNKYMIVAPKADDCITLLLGSYKDYKEYFDSHPGTYWYTASWIENGYTPSKENERIKYMEYAESFGEENAKYLIETKWCTKNYKSAAYVCWKGLKFKKFEQYTKDAARHYGWEYEKIMGKNTLLSDLINGKWDERFLVVPAGKEILPDYEGNIIRYE